MVFYEVCVWTKIFGQIVDTSQLELKPRQLYQSLPPARFSKKIPGNLRSETPDKNNSGMRSVPICIILMFLKGKSAKSGAKRPENWYEFLKIEHQTKQLLDFDTNGKVNSNWLVLCQNQTPLYFWDGPLPTHTVNQNDDLHCE